MALKIYSSKEWLAEGSKLVLMLTPYWGANHENTLDPDYGRFDDYLKNGKEIFELTNDIKKADIAVYPQEYTGPSSLGHLREIASLAKSHVKKLLVFYNADDDAAIPVENCLIFRTSFYKSKQQANEWALTGWSLDFLNYFPDQKWKAIEPQNSPSVSYCGYVDYETRGFKDTIKAKLKPALDSHEERAKTTRGVACRKLKRNSNIKTNFIIMKGFWAHGIDDKIAARKQYAENMMTSLYGIATRGGGNFSYRLYELLSCGRIPIFINTDSVLPFDTLIDWKEHVVWVEKKDLGSIDKILLDFHRSKSMEDLEQIQINNRKLYETHISPIGFHKTLAGFLKDKI